MNLTGGFFMSDKNLALTEEEKEEYIDKAKGYLTKLKKLMNKLGREINNEDFYRRAKAAYIVNFIGRAANESIEVISKVDN